MEVDSSVAIVFRCFEEFLRKAGTMDVFDTLVYNYRLKDEFLGPEKIQSFAVILEELIQNLTHLQKEIVKMKQVVMDSSQLNNFNSTPKSMVQSIGLTTDSHSGLTFPISIGNFDSQSHQILYTNSNSFDKNFLNMITLDNSNCYQIANDDPKNTTIGVVVGDLQTLFSVGLESATNNNNNTSQVVDNSAALQVIPESISNNMSNQSITESQTAPTRVTVGSDITTSGTPEVFLIPILKETVKSEEELSVSNICSMLDIDGSFDTPTTTTNAEETTLSQVVPAQKLQQAVNSSKAAVVTAKKPKIKIISTSAAIASTSCVKRTNSNETVSKDESLLFFCCDKCFHSYRTLEKFSVHKCTNSKALSEKISATFVKDNSCLRSMKKFVCGLCLEEYRNLDRIAFHLKRCEGGPFSCENCPSSAPQFPTMKSLNLHRQQQHKDERSFVCRDCGFPFKFKCSLQKHKLRAHNTELEPRTFPCDLCPSVFMKKIFLTNHKLKSHNADRPVLCHICGKSFTSQQSLKAHLDEVHFESNKFPCSECGKVFTRKEQLGFHMIIHTGIGKTHLCETCGKAFSKKSKLDDHFDRRHAVGVGKTFPCTSPNCSKSFKTKKDQKSHFRRMHGPKLKSSNNDNNECKISTNDTANVEVELIDKQNSELVNFQLFACSNGESSQNNSAESFKIQNTDDSSSRSSQNQFSTNPPSCEADLSCQAPDETVISDFMNALTPGQIERIIQDDILVPTLLP